MSAGTDKDDSGTAGTDGSDGAGPLAIVVVTHGDAGAAMIATVEKMTGRIPNLVAVRVETGEPRGDVERRLEEAVHDLGAHEALFLVDLFGSTPMRLCCASCQGHSMVVTGLNLAMLFKLSTALRAGVSARALATELAATGTKSIQVLGGPALTHCS